MNFNGKSAFVTGVSHGIGRAIVVQLAKQNGGLALADIDENGLGETAAIVKNYGTDVQTYVLDVTDEEAVRSSVADAAKQFGKIDILINNAGIYNTWKPFMQSISAEWKKKIEVNILGTMYCVSAVLPHMIENRYGRIVNIGSVAGSYGIANMADYSMTKGGVIAFTKALAKETAPYGITVNTVSPGSINVTEEENVMPEHSFMGRAGTPEECASVVVFLSSDEASYVSGQDYRVDGCRKKM